MSFGDSTGTQYCGSRTYLISSVVGTASTALTTSEVVIDINGLISVYTANKQTIGMHTVTVTVGFQNYLAIPTKTLTFTLEIIGCIITGFTMSLSSLND